MPFVKSSTSSAIVAVAPETRIFYGSITLRGLLADRRYSVRFGSGPLGCRSPNPRPIAAGGTRGLGRLACVKLGMRHAGMSREDSSPLAVTGTARPQRFMGEMKRPSDSCVAGGAVETAAENVLRRACAWRIVSSEHKLNQIRVLL